MKEKSESRMLILLRSLIGVVTFLNLQAAVQFMLMPQIYAPGFELSGTPGEAMIRGMGLLFLMWNIPYIVAIIHPLRHFVSLVEAVIMQGIGVFGETILRLTLKGEHPLIQESVRRFIFFDGGGLVLLLAALVIAIFFRRRERTIVN